MVTGALSGRRVAVLGAGMVGVSVALALLRRGAEVHLVDRAGPGQETSFGNAGVLARSSLWPINNPGLWRQLPRLLGNRQVGLRYDPGYLLRNLRWLSGFLAAATPARTAETTTALDGLIRLSIAQHQDLLRQTGEGARLRETGWMYLYRQAGAVAQAAPFRRALARHGVDHALLSRAQLSQAEPALRPIFDAALWIKDGASVDDPGAVVAAYARLFAAQGGQVHRQNVTVPQHRDGMWHLDEPPCPPCDTLVVCLGPWSREVLATMGYAVPMVSERGYHMHYAPPGAANLGLTRPVYDVAGGYVLSPMARGLRLSTGVELAASGAPPRPVQLELAERNARQAIDIGPRLDSAPWLGRRPTLPDSRPAIGALPDTNNLFVAFGHQHIGFSTGPGTGVLLADMMEGRPAALDPRPFDPARFIRRR